MLVRAARRARVGWEASYFTCALQRTPTRLGRTTVAAAFGTAQGLGGALIAAAAHRALHSPPSVPTAVSEVAQGASVMPALRELNHRLVSAVIERLRAQRPAPLAARMRESRGGKAGGARSQPDEIRAPGPHAATAMRALRNCCELGQVELAVDLYAVFRAEGARKLPAADAAIAIRWLGDGWVNHRPVRGRVRDRLGSATRRSDRHTAHAAWGDAAEPCAAADGVADGGAGQRGAVTVNANALKWEALRCALLVARDTCAEGDGVEGVGAPGGSGPGVGDAAEGGAREFAGLAGDVSAAVLDALMGTYAACGEVDRALVLHAAARACARPPPGENTLGLLIDALCRQARVSEATALYLEYERAGLRLRNRTLARLIEACAAHEPALAGVLPRLHAAQLPSEGVGVTVSLIRAHGARAELAEALRVYDDARRALSPHASLPRAGASPPLRLLNAALGACARAHDASAALAVYAEAVSERPSLPDAVSVNSLLAACSGSGQAWARRAGFHTLRRAAESGAGDLRGLATLMHACEQHADSRLALQVHAWAVGDGLRGMGLGGGEPRPRDHSPPSPVAAIGREARALLLDSLFLALDPCTEAERPRAKPDSVGGGGGGEEGAERAQQGVAADADADALGDLRVLDYAREAYHNGVASGLAFDGLSARRTLVALATGCGEFGEAHALLDDAESRGELLAPTQGCQELLLEQLREVGREIDEEQGDAALRLFGRFAEQREEDTWRAHAWRRAGVAGALSRAKPLVARLRAQAAGAAAAPLAAAAAPLAASPRAAERRTSPAEADGWAMASTRVPSRKHAGVAGAASSTLSDAPGPRPTGHPSRPAPHSAGDMCECEPPSATCRGSRQLRCESVAGATRRHQARSAQPQAVRWPQSWPSRAARQRTCALAGHHDSLRAAAHGG